MRVYLASTNSGLKEHDREEIVQKYKPLYFLETFFNGEKSCLKAMNAVGIENFLLDSGAFSYMNGATVTLEAMEKYVERYIKFIIDYKIKNYFEIDVDNIFGLEMVEHWRRRMEERTGRQSIPVWHKGRGVEYWKKMCQEYDYIAIGGLVFHVKVQEYDSIKKLVKYAYNRGVKVHGLGFTKTKTLKDYDFFSVDSSTWTVAAARGQMMYCFKNGEIKHHKINKDGQKVELSKLIAHNMIEWIKYQKFMEGIKV